MKKEKWDKILIVVEFEWQVRGIVWICKGLAFYALGSSIFEANGGISFFLKAE